MSFYSCIWGGLSFSWYLGGRFVYVRVVIYNYNLTYNTLSSIYFWHYYPSWLCEITLKCFFLLYPFLHQGISGALLLSFSMVLDTYTYIYWSVPMIFPASIGAANKCLPASTCTSFPQWALSGAPFLASQSKTCTCPVTFSPVFLSTLFLNGFRAHRWSFCRNFSVIICE